MSLSGQGKFLMDMMAEMEKIHNSNAQELNAIIDIIGFPTIDKVGFQPVKRHG